MTYRAKHAITVPSTPFPNRSPVIVWLSILTTLQLFFTGTAATTITIEASRTLSLIFAFGALAVAAAQGGIQFYINAMVTPNTAVVEKRTSDGTIVAGPANEIVSEGSAVRMVGEDPAHLMVEPAAHIYPDSEYENDGPDAA